MGGLNGPPHYSMLTKEEQKQAKAFAAGVWALLRYDPDTKVETWVKKLPINGGYKLEVMEVQKDIPQILDENTAIKSSQGADWAKAKHGSIVARVPIAIDNELKRQCGFDGVEYDKKKMNKILNDRDFSKLRTVDGRF